MKGREKNAHYELQKVLCIMNRGGHPRAQKTLTVCSDLWHMLSDTNIWLQEAETQEKLLRIAKRLVDDAEVNIDKDKNDSAGEIEVEKSVHEVC